MTTVISRDGTRTLDCVGSGLGVMAGHRGTRYCGGVAVSPRDVSVVHEDLFWEANELVDPRRHPYLDIHNERMRAHLKHFAAGKSAERMDAHDVRWLPVLTEELGEVARVLCDDGGLERLREELIQVAAMSSAWIAAIDRRASL